MIITRCPTRISLWGGGTDYQTHYRKHGGAALGFAIDKYVWVTLRHLPPFFEHKHRIVYSETELVQTIDEIKHPAVRETLRFVKAGSVGIEMHHDADIPARSGMGSSSSFTVGLLHALSALEGKMKTPRELAVEATYIEQQLIGESVGDQDQIFAAYGGFNRIDFSAAGFAVTPVILPVVRREELESTFMLFFTGQSRIAETMAKAQVARAEVNVATLNHMRQFVDVAMELLTGSGGLQALGALLHRNWEYKRTLANGISNPTIDTIYGEAIRAGAWGGKLLGAGAGGFMLFMVPPEKQPIVRMALQELIEVKFKIANEGSKVVLYQPNGL